MKVCITSSYQACLQLLILQFATNLFLSGLDDISETKAQLDRYDDEYQMSDIPSKAKNVKTKSNLRQANSELLAVSDKRYAGKRVSRKDLEDEDDDEASFEQESSEEDEEDIQLFNSKMKKDKKGASIPLKSKRTLQDVDSQQSSEDEDLGEEEEESGDQIDDEEEGEEGEEEEGSDDDEDFGSGEAIRHLC